MEINVARLGPLVEALKEVGVKLERIAVVLEADALDKGLISKPVRNDFKSDNPPTLTTTDEEADALRELVEERDQLMAWAKKMGLEAEEDDASGNE